jgi:hypothetical protein
MAFGLCLALVFLAMHGIMELGGLVAAGGPYGIAHPAPEWVGLLPVAIVCGMAAVGINVLAAHRAEGFTLVLPSWCALFLSLGWNSLEFGLSPPGGGTAWSWLVCAVVFALMGLSPPAIVALGGWELWPTERWPSEQAADRQARSRYRFKLGYTALVVVAAGAGAFLGMETFPV